MVKSITVFTSNSCAYCAMVKKYLGAKGQAYEEVNIDLQPDRQADVIKLSGVMSVPVTVVTKQDDTQEIIVGYNLAKLGPALAT